MSKQPGIRSHGVVAVIGTLDALRKSPTSVRELAEAAGVSRRTMRKWIATMQSMKRVRPFGVKPLQPGQRGMGPMLWTWVDSE